MRPIDGDFAKERIKKSDLTNREKIALLLLLEDVPMLAPPPNDPLTLEELREMGGEPVWVHLSNGRKRWAMVSGFGGASMETELILVWGAGLYVPASTIISNGGRIYRRKPEEGI